MTEEVSDVQESSSTPEEQPEQAAPEAAPEEISPKANRRIQELAKAKKEQEDRARKLEAQLQQLHQMYLAKVSGPETKTSGQPALDPEAQNIIHELGGDETAKKLYDVLGKAFGHSAKKEGFVSRQEAEKLAQQAAARYLGSMQSTLAVSSTVSKLVEDGTLDSSEAGWVTQKVAEIAKGNPRSMETPESAQMLVNMVLGQGFTSGDLKLNRKTRGTPTVVGPGRNSAGDTSDSGYKEVKAAAARFRSLAGLDDKELKTLYGKVSGD